MEVYQHLSVSFAVSVLFVLTTDLAPAVEGLMVVYGTLVGTLIDLDHFLIARWKKGDWRHLKSALKNPVQTVFDSSWLFATDIHPLERLLTHNVLGLIIIGVTYGVVTRNSVVDPFIVLARTDIVVLFATVLYVHVLSDITWGVVRRG